MTSQRLAFGLAAILLLVVFYCTQPTTIPDREVAALEADRARRDPYPFEITPANVASLEVAWVHSLARRFVTPSPLKLAFEATPILVGHRLILCSAEGDVLAVDAETGERVWKFAVPVEREAFEAEAAVHAGFSTRACRGVASDGEVESLEPTAAVDAGGNAAAGASTAATRAGSAGVCATRVYAGAADGVVYALDASTGEPCADFGHGGYVRVDSAASRIPGEPAFGVASPPLIIGSRIIVGTTIAPNALSASRSGEVVALDRVTGARLWTFDPIPRDRSDPARLSWAGNESPTSGAANVWAGMKADTDLDLVFVPTSSPSNPGFGGDRLGENRRANSLVALRASTGDVVWDFQAIHHDVWEYDLAAPPVLFDLDRGGRRTPAIALLTPTGRVFVLDRRTGRALVEIEERAVPESDVPGELLSPTQPVTKRFDSKENADSTDRGRAEIWGTNVVARMACSRKVGSLRNDGTFTPPTTDGSWILPGLPSVTGRGRLVWDAARRRLIFNATHVAHAYRLIDATTPESDFEVDGDEVLARFSAPASPFVLRVDATHSPFGAPCNAPPWGTLTSLPIDASGDVWQQPIGTTETGLGFGDDAAVGSANHGGPLATEAGLVFIAATEDRTLRVFDSASGESLAEFLLPFAGFSTPITYWGPKSRKQFVVLATTGKPSFAGRVEDALVAYSLPNSAEARPKSASESSNSDEGRNAD